VLPRRGRGTEHCHRAGHAHSRCCPQCSTVRGRLAGRRQRRTPRWTLATTRSSTALEPYPAQNAVLRDLLPTISTPTQIIAGRNDDLVPWSNNQYLDDLLPNSEIHPLAAGHFAWEQAPDQHARGGRQIRHTAESGPAGA
jgi:pimeloyl-ACP methyl ester carboxylesterase